jgi:hypothetical protein
MSRVSARTLDFFDRTVIEKIIEKYGLDEKEALRRFIKSKTYKILTRPELAFDKGSPLIVFELWECEQITGDPENSLYIRAEY